MTVRDMLTALQKLPRDTELLAFEADCEDYCERELDTVEWQGGRVYLHLGARRDDPPQGQPAEFLTSIGAGRRQGGHGGGVLGRLHTADGDPGGDEPGCQGQDAGWLLRCRELRA